MGEVIKILSDIRIEQSIEWTKKTDYFSFHKDLAGEYSPYNNKVSRFLNGIILQLLARADIVVVPLVPCRRSTGQVVILEAMSVGKPVIATATSGTKDYIVSRKNGILVPPGDPRRLQEAINEVKGDAELKKYLSVHAIETIKEYHTIVRYTSAILKAAEHMRLEKHA